MIKKKIYKNMVSVNAFFLFGGGRYTKEIVPLIVKGEGQLCDFKN